VSALAWAVLAVALSCAVAMAAVTRDQALRAARNVPMVRDALALIPDARTIVAPPSEANGGAWLVQFGVQDPQVPPLLSIRVHAETGEVLGVACDTNAFRLRRAEEYPLWSADQLAGVRTETARDIVRAIGDAPDLRPYFSEHRKAQLRVDYAPDARRWIGYVHEGGKLLGYVTYADGAIRDVHLTGLNWTPPPAPETPVAEFGRLLPRPGGAMALALALLVGLLLYMEPARPFGPRTWRVLALYAFFAVLLLFNPSPFYFALLMAVVVCLFALALRSADEGRPGVAPTALPKPLPVVLAGAAALVALSGLWAGEVDDSSRSGGIGARYVMKEGRLPYGADISSGSDIARDRNTYAPLFYLVHIPAEAVFPTTYQREGVRLRVGEAGWKDYFDRHTMRETASRVTVTFFFLALLAGVAVLGHRAGGPAVALAWVALCALGPPFLAGLCSGRIVPTVFLVWAIVFVKRPGVAGALLGLSASSYFVAAFAIPLWAGWYWRNRRGVTAFVAAVAAVGLATLALVLLCSNAPTSADALRAFLKETVGVQEGAQGMAGKDWGFWPSFPALRAWLQGPVMLGFALFCVALFFRPRVVGTLGLAALTAAVLVAVECWKSFGPGYLEWYFYLLVFAFFWPAAQGGDSSAAGSPDAVAPQGGS
jgi:hypothetical protein